MKNKLFIYIGCVFCLFILILGCHYEATYVAKCKIVSKTETTLEAENLYTHVNYECEATETEKINIGEKLYCKFTNECTESNPYDDHWIAFGKHSFLCFVW